MNDAASPASQPREAVLAADAAPSTPSAPPQPSATAASPAVPASPASSSLGALRIAVAVLAVLAIAALVLAWRADERVRGTERELVRRQQESATLVTEATLVARQAQEAARDAAAKAALLEARLNEVALQRSQLEALVQSVARSRDDNLVAEADATLRWDSGPGRVCLGCFVL